MVDMEVDMRGFGHKDNTGINEYALLQGKKSDDGHTYLNAYTDKNINFSIGGTKKSIRIFYTA